jgi:FemAB-related protein (PEP-CTERM system-associated)
MSAQRRTDEPTRVRSVRGAGGIAGPHQVVRAGAGPEAVTSQRRRPTSARIQVVLRRPEELAPQAAAYESLYGESDERRLSRHPAWLLILQSALGHVPFCVEARVGGRLEAILPFVLIQSRLFGRFLVSLPYLNSGGPLGRLSTEGLAQERLGRELIDRAVMHADELDVRFLELRNEMAEDHPQLVNSESTKVHMRLGLTASPDELWTNLRPKVRNQIRKGRRNGLVVCWGGAELVSDFYAVFARNMRDLGTPVYSRHLFETIVHRFPLESEVCIVRSGTRPVAAAILLHGDGVTEVPSASSLRAYNSTCANMLMYWHLLSRSIERGQRCFDFGRSSPESGTYRFKQQWGAQPVETVWQYYLRRGSLQDMRPDNRKYRSLIRIWRHLPVAVARWLGPRIVRGIP